MRLLGIAAVALLVVACGSTTPEGESEKDALNDACKQTIRKFRAEKGMAEWFDSKSHGYAVIPSVGKAGIGIGGAYGQGQVYEKGEMIGYCTMTQATVGLQLGAQAYAEVLFFKDKAALTTFTQSNWEPGAQASAVAANKGASADVEYSHGVAIFTMAAGGLMAEASVGGQKFKFEKN